MELFIAPAVESHWEHDGCCQASVIKGGSLSGTPGYTGLQHGKERSVCVCARDASFQKNTSICVLYIYYIRLDINF